MPKKVKEMPDKGVSGVEKTMKLQENLGHNEISSITPEGRFWIVTYRTMDGTKEKVFNSEKEARQFLEKIAYTQNGDKSYNVTYDDDGTKDIIAVSNDAWDSINDLNLKKGLKENEAVYDQIADLEYDLMMADTDERKAEIEAKIKALKAGLSESKLRSVIAKIIQEELKK